MTAPHYSADPAQLSLILPPGRRQPAAPVWVPLSLKEYHELSRFYDDGPIPRGRFVDARSAAA